MLTDLGLVLVLALGNAFFALAEIALIAARKSRLRYLAHSSRRAKVALALTQHPDRFLSTVQVGITSISILSGIVGEAAFSERVAHFLAGYDSAGSNRIA